VLTGNDRVWVFFERTWIFSGIRINPHFIEFVLVKTNQLVGSNQNVIYRRKMVSARAWLREATTKHQLGGFPCKFAVCFQYHNIEESQI